MTNTRNHALLSDQKIFALVIGLCNEISKSSSTADAANLLASLLTPQEIRTLSIRLQIREMLLNGRGYQEIRDELGVSLGTISRVRLSLEHLDKRPRSSNFRSPGRPSKAQTPLPPKRKGPAGPLAKYSSNGWPIQLLATILKEIFEKRTPP